MSARPLPPWGDPDHDAYVHRLVMFVVSSRRAMRRHERIAEARRPRPGDYLGRAA